MRIRNQKLALEVLLRIKEYLDAGNPVVYFDGLLGDEDDVTIGIALKKVFGEK